MDSYLVLTVISDDKPGLVEALSRTIADNSGNWLESSMSQLAGKFAGILRVSVPTAEADKLVTELNKLSDQFRLVIERAEADDRSKGRCVLQLSLVGNDRPGIVQEISQVLAEQKVNVEHLNSQCVPAPMSSAMLFKASARLTVDDEMQLEHLQTRLEGIANDLMVELLPLSAD